MQKKVVFLLSLLLLMGTYSFFPLDFQINAGSERKTRGFVDFEMDLNISDASLATYIGEAAGDGSGWSVSGAGDVNGDGYDDILIGAYNNDEGGSNAGQIYLVLGRSTGWSMDMNLSSADASFIGEAADDWAGRSVSGAGDVNGDGYDDILIGAYKNDEGGSNAGQTYFVLGRSTGWSMDMDLASSDASFIGEAAGDFSGGSVSGAGDVNDDGYDDILIGAFGNDEGGSNAGQTYLVLGRSTGWSMDMDLASSDASFISEAAGDSSGGSVSGAGDVNGDGYDDILVGAINNDEGGSNAGQTYLVLGRSTGWSMDMDLSSADASFIGEAASDNSGLSVSGAGDVNGDGYDDTLIGAFGNDEGGSSAGQTYLVLGRSTGWSMDMDLASSDASFIGEAAGDGLGWSVSGAGDVNGDGYDDILVGANNNDEGGSNAGQTYLVLGRSTGWSMDMDLSSADASFIGEAAGDGSGGSVSGAGDVNGDGYDDILVGANNNDEGGYDAGQTYLISGLGYSEPLEVYSVDLYSDSGFSTPATVADIGSTIYIEVKGLDSNASHQDTAIVNITFRPGSVGLIRVAYIETGNNTGIYRGFFIIPPGTIYLDTLNFSSRKDPTKFAHLFIDNPFRPTSISSLKTYYDSACTIEADKADLEDTFYIEVIGTDANPVSRNFALVNISSTYSMPLRIPILLNETGINTGAYRGEFQVPETFVWFENIEVVSCRDPSFYRNINVDKPFSPTRIDSVKTYWDSTHSKEINKIQREETLHIEVIGQDENPLTRDYAFVNLTFEKTIQPPILMLLKETGLHTGNYRNEFFIPNSTEMFENISVISAKDPTKNAKVMVCELVEIGPTEPIRIANEDEEYSVQYSNIGLADFSSWTFEIIGDWLSFDTGTLILSGTPENEDVGITSVALNLSDDIGHFSSQKFLISVENANPILTGENLLEINQGKYYEVDYDCNDDGQGNVTYHLSSNAEWLTMDYLSGIMNGTPTNDDVGIVTVTVSVHDGNEGWDSRQFDIKVINVNDPPIIITNDTLSVYQNDPFLKNYQALEIDSGDEIKWKLHTDAGFLSIDHEMGTLSGVPGYMDVGSYFVNVSVWDLSDEFDFHNFTLEVLNVNDGPAWVEFPENIDIVHGKTYLFDVNATDYDGDTTYYSVSSTPDSDITIDEDTGQINWTADIHIFEKAPFKLEVIVSAWDGIVFANRTFTITVLASLPPEVELIGPGDGEKGASTGAILSWEGTDPEGESITYDIYLHQTEVFVQGYREEAIYEEEYEGTNITLSDLDPGKTYFWTVIPNDGCSNGLCTSGVISFRVNYKPTFKTIEDQKISAGTNFKFKISCTDQDSEDLPNLRYSLIDAPEGMTLNAETGMIRWTPKGDQAIIHTVSVQISDGIETNQATFRVEVTQAESSSSSLFLIIIIAVIVVILLALGIFFFIKKKKQMDEAAIKRGEEERAALEKEKEDNTPSYEDLYGVPAPEKNEDGMTTSELKDYIHEQIEDLKGQE